MDFLLVKELINRDRLVIDVHYCKSSALEDAAKDIERDGRVKKEIVLLVNKEVKNIINKYGEKSGSDYCYLKIKTIDNLLEMIPKEKQKLVFFSYGSLQECIHDICYVVLVKENNKHEMFASDDEVKASEVYLNLLQERKNAEIINSYLSDYESEDVPVIWGNECHELMKIKKEKFDNIAEYIKLRSKE